MKKIFMILIALVCMTSCGTMASFNGSKQNNLTVEENVTVTKTDRNGTPMSVYESTQTSNTCTTFRNNSFKRVTKKRGRTYYTVSSFKGNTERD